MDQFRKFILKKLIYAVDFNPSTRGLVFKLHDSLDADTLEEIASEGLKYDLSTIASEDLVKNTVEDFNTYLSRPSKSSQPIYNTDPKDPAGTLYYIEVEDMSGLQVIELMKISSGRFLVLQSDDLCLQPKDILASSSNNLCVGKQIIAEVEDNDTLKGLYYKSGTIKNIRKYKESLAHEVIGSLFSYIKVGTNSADSEKLNIAMPPYAVLIGYLSTGARDYMTIVSDQPGSATLLDGTKYRSDDLVEWDRVE